MRPLFTEFLPHFRDVIPSLTFLFSWLMDLSLPLPTFIPTHPCFFPFSREWFEKSAANSRNSSANGDSGTCEVDYCRYSRGTWKSIPNYRPRRIHQLLWESLCFTFTGLTPVRYTRSMLNCSNRFLIFFHLIEKILHVQFLIYKWKANI